MSTGPFDDAVLRKITAADAKQIEKHLRVKPDDLAARFDLINFLWHNQWLGRNARRYKRRHAKHVLWMTRHAPESMGPYYPQFTIERRTEPAGYAKAKRAWLKQVGQHARNPKVLWNATLFFSRGGHKRARRIALQGAALEPQNPAWMEKIGHLWELEIYGQSAAKVKRGAKRSLAAYEAAVQPSSGKADEGLAVAVTRAAFRARDFTKAERYARDLLLWNNDDPSGRDGNDAVHHGNTVLGRLALRSGDVDAAKRYLLASGAVAGSPVLNSFGPTMVLARELLEVGEQLTVLEYFDLCAKFWKHHVAELTSWATTVRRGKIPDFRSHLYR